MEFQRYLVSDLVWPEDYTFEVWADTGEELFKELIQKMCDEPFFRRHIDSVNNGLCLRFQFDDRGNRIRFPDSDEGSLQERVDSYHNSVRRNIDSYFGEHKQLAQKYSDWWKQAILSLPSTPELPNELYAFCFKKELREPASPPLFEFVFTRVKATDEPKHRPSPFVW